MIDCQCHRTDPRPPSVCTRRCQPRKTEVVRWYLLWSRRRGQSAGRVWGLCLRQAERIGRFDRSAPPQARKKKPEIWARLPAGRRKARLHGPAGGTLTGDDRALRSRRQPARAAASTRRDARARSETPTRWRGRAARRVAFARRRTTARRLRNEPVPAAPGVAYVRAVAPTGRINSACGPGCSVIAAA